jgi:hypothetical protein
MDRKREMHFKCERQSHNAGLQKGKEINLMVEKGNISTYCSSLGSSHDFKFVSNDFGKELQTAGGVDLKQGVCDDDDSGGRCDDLLSVASKDLKDEDIMPGLRFSLPADTYRTVRIRTNEVRLRVCDEGFTYGATDPQLKASVWKSVNDRI